MLRSRLNPGVIALACAVLALAGCGGGGGGSSATTGSTTLSGAVAKGPLAGALITAYPVDASGTVGTTELGHATTDGNGLYSIGVGTYSGAVQLVATVTSATTDADEATGAAVTLPPGFVLHANTVVTPGSSSQTQSASLTPYTELANQLAVASGGITSTNIKSANGVVFTLLGFDPVATVPVPSTATPPSSASTPQVRYGLFNAAVSQLANSTPVTTDAATLGCFAAAGSNVGAKIQCATNQIAAAVSVSTSGGTTQAVSTKALVGLSDALLAASTSSTINKTGQAIATSDPVVVTLSGQESAATNGTSPSTPISSGTNTQAASDVATAKTFFANLRANAAALGTSSVSTGIVDGMKAFGDSLNTDATSLAVETTKLISLADQGYALWLAYTSGQTTNPVGGSVPGVNGGCTIYQGAVPTSANVFDSGVLNSPYIPAPTTATSPTAATWLACSVNSGPLPSNGTARYRQTILIDPSAGWSAAKYYAVTRSQYVSGGNTYSVNLAPTLSGTIDLTTSTGGTVTGLAIVGDLPPATDASGNLLSQRYPIDIAASVSTLASGAGQVSVTSGTLGVVPVGGTTPRLVINLAAGSSAGAAGLVAVVPTDRTNAAQVAAAQISWAASITEPNGSLNGSVLINQFSYDPSTGALTPGNLKFTGSVAVAPVVSGTAQAVTTWAALTLQVTNGSAPVVSFTGSLTPAGLAPLTMTASITETAANTYALQGTYVQNALNVSITGTQSPSARSVTFAGAGGVSVTLTGAAASADVTVSGRQTAVIDKGSDTITYSDGTFETLVNP